MKAKTSNTSARNKARKTKRPALIDRSLLPELIEPADLEKDASKVWAAIVPGLVKAEMVSWLDMEVLRQYCETVSEMRRLQLYLREHGDVIEIKKGSWQRRPELQRLAELHRQFSKLTETLGLSPKARQKLNMRLQ